MSDQHELGDTRASAWTTRRRSCTREIVDAWSWANGGSFCSPDAPADAGTAAGGGVRGSSGGVGGGTERTTMPVNRDCAAGGGGATAAAGARKDGVIPGDTG